MTDSRICTSFSDPYGQGFLKRANFTITVQQNIRVKNYLLKSSFTRTNLKNRREIPVENEEVWITITFGNITSNIQISVTMN